MQSQRISGASQANRFYYGDDCLAWAYGLSNQKAIGKRFNYHWHPELELYCVTEGNYELYTGQTTYDLNTGDICIISPGVDHSFRCISQHGMYYSIGFSTRFVGLDEGHFFQKNFIEPLGQGTLDFDPVVCLSNPDYICFREPIDQIIRTQNDRDKLVMYSSAVAICCALMRRSKPKEKTTEGCSKEHNSVQLCVAYIQKNYMHKITLEQLAVLSNLHPNYLCTLFNKYTGSSPMTYLNKVRMQRARVLLRETDLSIRQIAEQTGFNSASFFSKRFKAVMGIPPAEYGAAYRKNKPVK